MKTLLLLASTTLLASCASRPAKKITIAPPLSRRGDASTVRLPERVREYRFGRYVDPGDPFIMHDGHPVYRIEETAEWNLRPKPSAPSARAASPGTAAPSPNDAAVAELNKQRAATRVFTEQTTTLNQQLAEMTKAVAQTREMAVQNLQLKQEMATLRERLDAVQAQARPRDGNQPASSTSPKDDKW